MKLFNWILTMCILGFSITSCNKHDSNDDLKQSGKKNLSSERMLTDEQIEEMGNYHNQYLQEAFEDISYASGEIDWQEVRSSFQNIINENDLEFDLDDMELNANITFAHLESQLSIEALDILYNAYENTDYSEYNVEMVTDHLEDLENEARGVLFGQELDIVLVSLNVFKKSVYFWAPESDGGSGLGEIIFLEAQEIAGGTVEYDFSRAVEVAASDGLAGAGGCLGVAVSAALATGPVGWGVFGGVLVGMAFASGVAALRTSFL